MTPLVSTVFNILSVLTVIGDVVVVFLLVVLLVRRFRKSNRIIQFFGKNALLFAFMVALMATFGSLFLSEVAKFEPCRLCWFQRIFMYPQVILFGVALWKNDRSVAVYSIALSVIGAIIAMYHYYLQVFAKSSVCSLVDYSASCTQQFILKFGYITIPMMSLTAFLMIILFMVSMKRAMKDKGDQVLLADIKG